MARIVCMCGGKWKRQRRGRVGVKSPKEEDSLELNYPSSPSLPSSPALLFSQCRHPSLTEMELMANY
ncbi:hypothetical protein NL676_009949 [Syzygium grande]|nr:hypothetical protein NL676_009949 [Syzygium grande]